MTDALSHGLPKVRHDQTSTWAFRQHKNCFSKSRQRQNVDNSPVSGPRSESEPLPLHRNTSPHPPALQIITLGHTQVIHLWESCSASALLYVTIYRTHSCLLHLALHWLQALICFIPQRPTLSSEASFHGYSALSPRSHSENTILGSSNRTVRLVCLSTAF